MPRTQPCAMCGEPKIVGPGSRESVVCQPCRRTPEWRAMMLERQRQRAHEYQREKREAAGLLPKPPKSDQPCAVCDTMQPRKLCEAHRNWKRVTCHTCGIETYSANKASAKRKVYCKPCSPGRGWTPPTLRRRCRHCAALLPMGSAKDRKACDTCLEGKPWEMRPDLTSGSWRTCNRCGVIKSRRNCKPDTYTCHPCRREVSGIPAKPPLISKAKPRAQRDYRKRAKRFGVDYEPIDRRKVFERDGWRCGICRDKIDKRLSYPHWMSASLDHVVPMSLGGGHLYVNTQASHLLCNVLKSNRIGGDQLALIG